MGILNKRKEHTGTAAPQSVRHKHPFTVLDSYSPLSVNEMYLYKTLRESVPIIDAAIGKIVRLTVDFTLESEDSKVSNMLNRWKDSLQVNAYGMGMDHFLSSYLEQLLTYGTALGEIVPSSDGKDIAALYNARLDNIALIHDDNPLKLKICRRVGTKTIPVKYPQLILLSLLNPEPGTLHGTSLLRGLPFVSSILLKIYNSIGVNWDRAGNLRYAVTYKPDSGMADRVSAKERAMQIAEEWSKSMSADTVRDFVAVGDVSIKVIGADNQMMDSEIPVKQMLEQIVAKTGIPPFLLGLSWSSTERMSEQQADILTSELDHYRRLLTPVICRICNTYLKLRGIPGDFSVAWADINLQDQVEQAKARLYHAQAAQIEAAVAKS